MNKKATQNEYHELKGQMISRGTNIARWARKHSYPLTTVYLAASGQRAGIKSTKIRRELEKFVNA